jgi:hypothetical protein
VKQHSGFLLFLTGYPASDYDLPPKIQGKQRGNYEGTGKKIFLSRGYTNCYPASFLFDLQAVSGVLSGYKNPVHGER